MLTVLLEYALILGLMTGLAVLMGRWLTRVFCGTGHGWAERATYRLLGVDPGETMGWARYGSALLLSNGAMMLLGYLLLRLQGTMPINPLGLAAQSPDLAFNTAASFITNTNWQAYSGETSLSNFSQMAVITFLMFVGATAGVVAAAGFIRGLSRSRSADIGNYWVDFTRILYRVMLPLCLVMALVYVWQGMPQTLSSEALASTLEGARQQVIVGAVASFESIKHIGTNGGGFFGMNAAHPFENPTPLTNALHILSMLLIPSALTYAFGSMLVRRRQGWVFFGTFLVMFIGFLAVVFSAEQGGNPLLTRLGADQSLSAFQSGGNMEGKELRFGIADTSLFIATTTGATTGSVNAMHDSLMPMGGFVPMAQMMLNCVFGGDGVGFINLIQYALLTVFLVGMMIGRTPEFLGKRIEAREMKLVMLSVLAHPICILGFSALAALWPATLDSLNNVGPHGFSEVLYAYTSGTANNGSAFAGLNANTPFFNTTIGLAMLLGRFFTMLPMLAVAGCLAMKKSTPAGAGTIPTATPLFMFLVVFVVLVVGGLTFLPALALGPIVEQLQLLSGQTYK
ncbi:potassium-transporting ATPase subunit KdpA [Pseudomonas gingeri NCPPB 3146 = LMG 5327]|uniref:Potassium-transporting ATPase potassium-binding subunit n=2 Tax=Pseudomonas gingeri TaxID=117681 RepID=A0A7Y8CFY9_9PSED|nr:MULTISPECIES: potassium-transporting ATPase subunit KdpA [Pseudomonas]NVZ26179.1 potassium-transporting ATPase subunit KdpA [Pseudomonas gingeri]NWC17429.1 potassium-transporting ATPase subunit KdpA [Pseudomonas gingeri]NWE49170.1 potassium-transporting ATPase subunit KdpA [Pseudomonas gingeri]PNQ89551.1 potassium-transporting ATPase subunit KdpA [Pseudomonas gingeri NCPPB 3146 = LMG 5327]BBP78959.1 potassium-transporting ATPase potassium-binding subunit [Pseudomonas sp. Ost2]